MDSVCQVCGKVFSDIQYMKEHCRRVHAKKNFRCHHCSFATRYKFGLKNHIEKVHTNEEKKKKCSNIEGNIECSLCKQFKCRNRTEMIDHYEDSHDVRVERMLFEFANSDAFETWKLEVERSERCRFVLRRGVEKSGRMIVRRYYCFRDGIFTPRGQGKRKLKHLGSNKICGICPARITKSEDPESSTIHVEYISQHVGHSPDIGRLNLTKSEKDEIARKLAAKLPFDVILDGIRDSLSGNQVERYHLTTSKDLRNLQRDYNIQGESILPSNNCASVQDWITMAQNELDIIQFYKPLNCLVQSRPELKEEDFVLVVANCAQLEMLKTYGHEGICMDNAQGNQCDFGLTTILVLDETNQGFPCAFLISNRCDTGIISLFVAVLKDSLQSTIETKIFMSDIAEKYYNGWCQEMPVPQHRLFCTWHVDRAWRKHLCQIRDLGKRAEAYNIIRTLMEESDESAFQTIYDRAMDLFKCDEDFSKFGRYFESNYSGTVTSWAFCYRPYLNFGTNLHLESMHKVIKCKYLQGKKAKRLDRAIDALMKFTRDKLYDQLVLTYRGTMSWKIKAIRARHTKSIPMTNTIIPTEQGWLVTSQYRNEVFEVTEHNSSCTCCLRCQDCEKCVHAFRCTCSDSKHKWNFCKHIHYVISYLKKTAHEILPDDSIAVEEENPFNLDLQEETISTSAIVEEISLEQESTLDSEYEQKKQSILETVLAIFEKSPTVDHLDILEKAMAPVLPTLEAIESGILALPTTRF